MSTKFVLFRTAGTNESEPILINPAHVRTVRQSGSAQWPAAGFVDTENRWFMKPEVGNGKTVIQSRV
jgi:hypothetical protein